MVSLIQHPKSARILEPSCGKGIFLDKLRKQGFNRILGYEIDPNLDCGWDCVRYESFISSPISDTYDVVIGNPPYIRWKNLEPDLKTELENSTLWKKYFNSLCDYLFIFILKSIEQLNDRGELIFICPEYWMNTTHSKSLRDYMVLNGHFSDIYHFKEAPLFEGVTSSFIIFRYIKSLERKDIVLHKYRGKGKPEIEELQSGICFEHTEISQFQHDKRWLLANKEECRRINAFEQSCIKKGETQDDSTELHRIGNYCDIGNGMVSGLDKAFQIADISVLNEYERKYLIQVYKAKDLDQYFNSSENYYFFIDENLTEKTFKEKCPNLYRQITSYSIDLDKRYNYGKNLKKWEFAFPRNKSLFERKEKRILIPCKERISKRNFFRFTMAESDIFPLQDVTGIFKKDVCREDIEYLLAYLNNPRVFEWLKYNGIIKGGIVEFSEAPLASIPYRPINWKNAHETTLHKRIVESTRQYIQKKENKYLKLIETNFNILFNEHN